MDKLIVFIGKPGVGKTTIIRSLFADVRVVDVRPFVIAYEVNGIVPGEKTIDGYRDMYRHLKELDDGLVVLELGTNHPELNVSEIKNFDCSIFILDAAVDICRERIIGRNRGDDLEVMERRLKKDFPNSHTTLFDAEGIEYVVLDMAEELEFNKKRILDLLKKK